MPSDARLSLYDYRASAELAKQDPPFYALIAAAMRKADTPNIERLRANWPDVWDDLDMRYNAPGGVLPSDGVPIP